MCSSQSQPTAWQDFCPGAKLLPCSHDRSQNTNPGKCPVQAADSEGRCLINISFVTPGCCWFQIIHFNSQFCPRPVYFTKVLITAAFRYLMPHVLLFFLKKLCVHHITLDNSSRHPTRSFKYPKNLSDNNGLSSIVGFTNTRVLKVLTEETFVELRFSN